MLNKTELAMLIAQRTGSSHKESRAFLDAFCAELGDALSAGETVQLTGTGTFTVRETPAHTGFNPMTKQPIAIAAQKTPVFKAGKQLKEKVNGTKN